MSPPREQAGQLAAMEQVAAELGIPLHAMWPPPGLPAAVLGGAEGAGEEEGEEGEEGEGEGEEEEEAEQQQQQEGDALGAALGPMWHHGQGVAFANLLDMPSEGERWASRPEFCRKMATYDGGHFCFCDSARLADELAGTCSVGTKTLATTLCSRCWCCAAAT